LVLLLNLPLNTFALLFTNAVLIQQILVVFYNKTEIEIWEASWAEEDCKSVGIVTIRFISHFFSINSYE
jgi:hypothetical protein